MAEQKKTDWADEWSFVRERLLSSGYDNFTGGEARKSYPFRSRYQHTKRVMAWMKRIISDRPQVDREMMELAIIFHDIGYCIGENKKHCIHSEEIFREYASARSNDELAHSIYRDKDKIERIAYLIRMHSDKFRLGKEQLDDDILILMEADLLDEEGAMRIAWDGMAEGMAGGESFDALLYRHKKFWNPDYNPMVTPLAREYFSRKQALMREYLGQLSFDLEVEG